MFKKISKFSTVISTMAMCHIVVFDAPAQAMSLIGDNVNIDISITSNPSFNSPLNVNTTATVIDPGAEVVQAFSVDGNDASITVDFGVSDFRIEFLESFAIADGFNSRTFVFSDLDFLGGDVIGGVSVVGGNGAEFVSATIFTDDTITVNTDSFITTDNVPVDINFRIATRAVPEPSTAAGSLVILAAGYLKRRRDHRKHK